MLQSYYFTSSMKRPAGISNEDLQKWKGASGDPFENEEKIKQLIPPPGFVSKEIDSFIDYNIAKSLSKKEKAAWIQRKVERTLSGLEEGVSQKFFAEFIAFLLGKTHPSSEEFFTIRETSMDPRFYALDEKVRDTNGWDVRKMPPVGRVDEYGDEIRAYIQTYTDRHFRMIRKVIQLKTEGPKSLSEHWLYFKYIVKGHIKDFGTRPIPELFLNYEDWLDPDGQYGAFTDEDDKKGFRGYDKWVNKFASGPGKEETVYNQKAYQLRTGNGISIEETGLSDWFPGYQDPLKADRRRARKISKMEKREYQREKRSQVDPGTFLRDPSDDDGYDGPGAGFGGASGGGFGGGGSFNGPGPGPGEGEGDGDGNGKGGDGGDGKGQQFQTNQYSFNIDPQNQQLINNMFTKQFNNALIEASQSLDVTGLRDAIAKNINESLKKIKLDVYAPKFNVINNNPSTVDLEAPLVNYTNPNVGPVEFTAPRVQYQDNNPQIYRAELPKVEFVRHPETPETFHTTAPKFLPQEDPNKPSHFVSLEPEWRAEYGKKPVFVPTEEKGKKKGVITEEQMTNMISGFANAVSEKMKEAVNKSTEVENLKLELQKRQQENQMLSVQLEALNKIGSENAAKTQAQLSESKAFTDQLSLTLTQKQAEYEAREASRNAQLAQFYSQVQKVLQKVQQKDLSAVPQSTIQYVKEVDMKDEEGLLEKTAGFLSLITESLTKAPNKKPPENTVEEMHKKEAEKTKPTVPPPVPSPQPTPPAPSPAVDLSKLDKIADSIQAIVNNSKDFKDTVTEFNKLITENKELNKEIKKSIVESYAKKNSDKLDKVVQKMENMAQFEQLTALKTSIENLSKASQTVSGFTEETAKQYVETMKTSVIQGFNASLNDIRTRISSEVSLAINQDLQLNRESYAQLYNLLKPAFAPPQELLQGQADMNIPIILAGMKQNLDPLQQNTINAVTSQIEQRYRAEMENLRAEITRNQAELANATKLSEVLATFGQIMNSLGNIPSSYTAMSKEIASSLSAQVVRNLQRVSRKDSHQALRMAQITAKRLSVASAAVAASASDSTIQQQEDKIETVQAGTQVLLETAKVLEASPETYTQPGFAQEVQVFKEQLQETDEQLQMNSDSASIRKKMMALKAAQNFNKNHPGSKKTLQARARETGLQPNQVTLLKQQLNEHLSDKEGGSLGGFVYEYVKKGSGNKNPRIKNLQEMVESREDKERIKRAYSEYSRQQEDAEMEFEEPEEKIENRDKIGYTGISDDLRVDYSDQDFINFMNTEFENQQTSFEKFVSERREYFQESKMAKEQGRTEDYFRVESDLLLQRVKMDGMYRKYIAQTLASEEGFSKGAFTAFSQFGLTDSDIGQLKQNTDQELLDYEADRAGDGDVYNELIISEIFDRESESEYSEIVNEEAAISTLTNLVISLERIALQNNIDPNALTLASAVNSPDGFNEVLETMNLIFGETAEKYKNVTGAKGQLLSKNNQKRLESLKTAITNVFLMENDQTGAVFLEDSPITEFTQTEIAMMQNIAKTMNNRDRQNVEAYLQNMSQLEPEQRQNVLENLRIVLVKKYSFEGMVRSIYKVPETGQVEDFKRKSLPEIKQSLQKFKTGLANRNLVKNLGTLKSGGVVSQAPGMISNRTQLTTY